VSRGWVWLAVVAVVALSAGLDEALDAHVSFPGFYAVLGLVGALAVILGSAGLGALGLWQGEPDAGGDEPAGGDASRHQRAPDG